MKMKNRIFVSVIALLLFFSMSIFGLTATADEPPEDNLQTDSPETQSPTFTQISPDIGGNAQLVERQEILFSSEKFEFISVTSRNGNVFYIFIRHDLPEDVANVFFLSKVSERELLSLINSSDTLEEYDRNNPLLNQNTSRNPAQTRPQNGNESANSPNEKTDSAGRDFPVSTTNIIIAGIVVVGAGGYGFYLSKKGKKKTKKYHQDEEDDEYDNDEYSEE